MNKPSTPIIALAAITTLLLLPAGNLFAQEDPTDYPTITTQPDDQGTYVGSNVTFSVTATNADSYQWLRNGTSIDGETNQTLSITNVSLDDVAYYTCYVSKDAQAVPTRSAVLNAVTSNDGVGNVTVFGPTTANTGSGTGCPGAFTGYATYIKVSGWGWSPTGTFHSAADTNRLDTKVEYVGRYGDHGCNQTTAVIPNPAPNPKYRFSIYFTNNVPTNPYPITLTGFLP
jgi:hypothetical protein